MSRLRRNKKRTSEEVFASNLKRNTEPKKSTTRIHNDSGMEVVCDATNSILISGKKNAFACQKKGLIAHRNKKIGPKGKPIDPMKVSISQKENEIFLKYTNGDINKTTANKLLSKLTKKKKKYYK